jgi:rfaE bifunctional protein nucleotidyltransferase chain/domain
MKRKYSKRSIVVCVSGYFDPIHRGHIEYLRLAKKLGDRLVVILNNDKQAKMKKGFIFMPIEDRAAILRAIKFVDEVVISIDKDQTQRKSLEMLKPDIFAKGGDRYAYEIPEAEICMKHGIRIVDGLGKKIQSSSTLVNKIKGKRPKGRRQK